MRPFDSRPWQRAHPRLRIPDSDAISELSILSLSLSLSNRWTEPLRRCPTHNELVKLERDSIIGISMRVPAVFETWPRVLQEIASRIRRMGEKRRKRNTSAQTFGKITEGHPISTFNGNHSEREIIAFNHHRISFAIHPFLPPDIPSSLSLSLSHTFRSKPRFIGSNDPWRPDEGRSTTQRAPSLLFSTQGNVSA